MKLNLFRLKDYAHGTGHGVGMYLNVHEYPVGIGTSYTVGLEEGMFTSVEPGYYEAGQFGIRHENVVVVQNSTKFPETHLMFDREYSCIIIFKLSLFRIKVIHVCPDN